MTKRPRPAPPPPLQTIDLATLDTVDGGINWRYHAYRIGLGIAHSDPARLASNFLM